MNYLSIKKKIAKKKKKQENAKISVFAGLIHFKLIIIIIIFWFIFFFGYYYYYYYICDSVPWCIRCCHFSIHFLISLIPIQLTHQFEQTKKQKKINN